MENLTLFKTATGKPIYIQTSAAVAPAEKHKSSDGQPLFRMGAPSVAANAVQDLSDALDPLKAVSESILGTFKNLVNSPDELEIELSITLTAEAGIIITKGSVEGNFKINMKWIKDKS